MNGASEPHSFPADTPVAADLVDGAVMDLNVMSRRGTVRHRLTRRVVDGSAILTCVASATLALCRGEVKAHAEGVTFDIGRNDTLVVTACAEVRTEEPVAIYVAEFWRV